MEEGFPEVAAAFKMIASANAEKNQPLRST
jgi:hypothetical protein